jgi:hypothetical protein
MHDGIAVTDATPAQFRRQQRRCTDRSTRRSSNGLRNQEEQGDGPELATAR